MGEENSDIIFSSSLRFTVCLCMRIETIATITQPQPQNTDTRKIKSKATSYSQCHHQLTVYSPILVLEAMRYFSPLNNCSLGMSVGFVPDSAPFLLLLYSPPLADPPALISSTTTISDPGNDHLDSYPCTLSPGAPLA